MSDEPAGNKRQMTTLLVFNGDFDRVQAALMVALGAAASGHQVSMYFSFWAVLALRRKRTLKGKGWIARLMTLTLPAGFMGLGTSRMNFGGIGPRMFGAVMKHKGIDRPAELFDLVREMGVRIVVCPLSMEMMGIDCNELVEGVEIGGVTSFVGDAAQSQVSLVF